MEVIKMKKTLSILIALVFGFAQIGFAAGVTLSDSEMDSIHAGDWVILDGPDGPTVADVYHTNNTIDLTDDSQKDIQAVSNANVVDSGVAVQANVAHVSGDTASTNELVNNSNIANITNYAPADEMKMTHKETMTASHTSRTEITESSSESCEIGGSSSSSETSSSSSSSGGSASAGITETLFIDANYTSSSSSSLSGETEDKSGETELDGSSASASAGVFDLDYIKNASASISCEESSSESSGSSSSESFTASHTSSSQTSNIADETCSLTVEEECSIESRSNLGRNNHIDLEDVSQTNVQAVSNLNSVASGAAIQANISSNVGAAGTISQSNGATVVSGL
jgi:hypothetical protein